MRTDRLFKRFFPAVLVLLIGIAAYFQVTGLLRLARPISLPPVSPAAPPAKSASALLFATADRGEGARAILSRNPFESVVHSEPPSETVDSVVPCPNARVLLITRSDEPAWSFAAIAAPDGKSSLHRIGDEVNGYKIDEIEWDRVWMTGAAGARCQLIMGDAPPSATPPPSGTSTAAEKQGPPPGQAHPNRRRGQVTVSRD